MTYIRKSVERTGWREWIDQHPSQEGWGADEFDILVRADAPINLLQKLWGRNYVTIKKWLSAYNKDKSHAQS